MWMLKGKQTEQWSHTSHLLAWIENQNRTKRDGAVSPDQRNPFLVEDSKQNRETISDPGHLARMMGLKVDDDFERRKRREERKAKMAAEKAGGE